MATITLHQLCSVRKGDEINYFIRCMAGIPHSYEEHEFVWYAKKVTCPHCISRFPQRVVPDGRRALVRHINTDHPQLKKFLKKENVWKMFIDNCLGQAVKCVATINLEETLVNSFDWSRTPEKKAFWLNLNHKWLETCNERRIIRRRTRLI